MPQILIYPVNGVPVDVKIPVWVAVPLIAGKHVKETAKTLVPTHVLIVAVSDVAMDVRGVAEAIACHHV